MADSEKPYGRVLLVTSTAHEVRAMLHLLLTAMVKDREAVRITTVVPSQGTTIFRVWVAEGDLGKVIGGQGKTIQALRTVIYSIAKENRLSVVVELCDARNDDVEDSSELVLLPFSDPVELQRVNERGGKY